MGPHSRKHKKRFVGSKHHLYGNVSTAGLKKSVWFAQIGSYHLFQIVQDASILRDVLHNYELSVSPADNTRIKKSTVRNMENTQQCQRFHTS